VDDQLSNGNVEAVVVERKLFGGRTSDIDVGEACADCAARWSGSSRLRSSLLLLG